MVKQWDVVIVGGGAAGLAAAVMIARRRGGGDGVLVLEKAPRVGKKLLATGNGTCNITNLHAAPASYHGVGWQAADAVTLPLTPAQAMEFFESIGLLCEVRENGRVYPVSEQAAAVLDCLRLELDRLGVTVRCDSPVTAIQKSEDGFVLTAAGATVRARRVVIATGGAAAPALGGSAESYALPLALGHRKTPLFPSIVQVRTDTAFVRAMKGLRTDAVVTFVLDGRPLASHQGELLFTEYGISGPAVMQISRVAGDWERRKRGTFTAQLDLIPRLSRAELLGLLRRRRQLGRRGEDYLTGLLNKRIGQTVCRAAGISLTDSTAQLNEAQLQRLCDTIKAFTLSVTGTQGFGGAQVTAGGVCLNEVDPATMESRLVKGLYLIGEVLDVDGDCGGFNLQWAWASAHAAACHAAGGDA